MKKKIKKGLMLILLGTLSISGCKKTGNLIDEKIPSKAENLPNNLIEVKIFYAMILGVDSSMINYNDVKKTFSIKNTKVEESFELINESYLIYKKHNVK